MKGCNGECRNTTSRIVGCWRAFGRFVWPEMLWLALVLLLVLLYFWLLGRRKKMVLRHSRLALIKEALGKSTG